MAYPVTLNGRTYTLADFEGVNYVEGLPDAFEDFVTHAGDIYNDTSTTSNAIGTGSKTFTVSSGKPYQAGTPLRIADAAAPATNFLDAVVTSYSGTTLVVEAVGYGGSGTKTSWTVNIGGAKTADGTLGVSQGGTGATTAAAALTNLGTYSKTEADSRFLNVSGEASDVTMTGNVTIGDADTDTFTINAATTTTADISFGDNDKAIFGAGSDLQIYHSGGNSYVTDLGTGNLILTSNGTGINFLKSDLNAYLAKFDIDGAVTLYHNGNPKLATTSTGVDITGTAVADGLTSSGALSVDAEAISQIKSGVSSDVLRLGNDSGTYVLGFASSLASMDLGASDNFRIRHGSAESFRATPSGVILNEISNADVDFRVESDTNTHMLFVDAGGGYVSVGTAGNLNGKLNVSGSIVATNGQTVDPDALSAGNVALGQIADGSGWGAVGLGWKGSGAGDTAAIGYAGETLYFAMGDGTNADSFATVFRLSRTEIAVNPDSANIDFRVGSDNSNYALFVDAGNNRIGFFNSAPSAPLHLIAGTPSVFSDAFQIGDGTYTNIAMYSGAADGEIRIGAAGALRGRYAAQYAGTRSVHDFALGTNNNERIGMKGDGSSVVINEAGANTDFRVESVSNSHMMFVPAGNNVVCFGTSRETGLAVQNTDIGVQINQYGRIFMATDDHSDFNRFNTGELFRFRRNAVAVGNIAVSSSSTTYNTTSDYRLKENVVDLTGATERLKQLSPKRFNFIIEPDETMDGFIAHEVSDIVPQAVTGEKDAVDADGNPEYQGIDQSKLVPLLVKTIQELEARITALENA